MPLFVAGLTSAKRLDLAGMSACTSAIGTRERKASRTGSAQYQPSKWKDAPVDVTSVMFSIASRSSTKPVPSSAGVNLATLLTTISWMSPSAGSPSRRPVASPDVACIIVSYASWLNTTCGPSGAVRRFSGLAVTSCSLLIMAPIVLYARALCGCG